MALLDCCCGDGDGAVDGGTAAAEGHIELIAAADDVEEEVVGDGVGRHVLDDAPVRRVPPPGLHQVPCFVLRLHVE